MNDDLDSIELGSDAPAPSYRQQAMERRQADEREALKQSLRRSRQSGINHTVSQLNAAGLNDQDTSAGPVSADFNPQHPVAPEVVEQATALLDELETDADAIADAIEAFIEAGGEV